MRIGRQNLEMANYNQNINEKLRLNNFFEFRLCYTKVEWRFIRISVFKNYEKDILSKFLFSNKSCINDKPCVGREHSM